MACKAVDFVIIDCRMLRFLKSNLVCIERKGNEMKRSDDTKIYQNDKSSRLDNNQSSNIIGFAAFKEKKADDEYKKAINNILARAQKVDW